MESVYLVGSEAVQSAGSQIQSAAGVIQQAASFFSDTPYRLTQSLDEHAQAILRASEEPKDRHYRNRSVHVRPRSAFAHRSVAFDARLCDTRKDV